MEMEDYRESNSFDDVNMDNKNINIVYKPDDFEDIPKVSIKSEPEPHRPEYLANDAAVPCDDRKFQSTDYQPKSKTFDSDDLPNSTGYGIMRWTVTSSNSIPLVKIEEPVNIESTDFETEPQKGKLDNDTFSTSNDLTAHQSANKADNLFKCDVCNKEFTQLGTLRIHHKILHTGSKTYVCKICGELCSDQSDLNTHELTHTRVKPHMSSVCGEKFIAAEELAQHRITHGPEKAFKCDICGKGFSRSFLLVRHGRCHTGEKPCKCATCGRGFSHQMYHDRHNCIRKKYHKKCPDCGKIFVNGYSLRRHRRIHTGEKRYECDFCHKKFTDKSNLTEHRRTHTGEKPYKCDICQREYARSQSLRKHLCIRGGD